MSQHHENIFDKMFHHHKHQDSHSQQSASQGKNDNAQYPSQQSNLHEEESQPSHHGEEEGVVNRFEDYIKEDEELEKEGQTYGGLM
ncbi:hypothetical protein AnigIFM56816_010221 [Aspergillus niger]|nr:hypothetical protein AnigIFM56816_010221 [Aspergillus niger]